MRQLKVAPHAGAWIETWKAVCLLSYLLASRPMRARGLKLDVEELRIVVGAVAPHAGAWIETG